MITTEQSTNRKAYYSKVKDDLHRLGEFVTTAELRRRYKLSSGAASSLVYRLKKDPTIIVDVRQDDAVTFIKVTKKTVVKQMSREDILWRALTTKRWTEIARLAA